MPLRSLGNRLLPQRHREEQQPTVARELWLIHFQQDLATTGEVRAQLQRIGHGPDTAQQQRRRPLLLINELDTVVRTQHRQIRRRD